MPHPAVSGGLDRGEGGQYSWDRQLWVQTAWELELVENPPHNAHCHLGPNHLSPMLQDQEWTPKALSTKKIMIL